MPADSRRPLILVTGSSGLIGRKIVDDLSPEYRVVGLDIDEPDSLPANAHFIACDLTNDASVAAAIDHVSTEYGPRIASVVHLAAYVDFSGEPSPLYEDLTIGGTRRLLNALRGKPVEQLIFSSTLLVMKPAEPGETLTESSPLQGEWDYPRSKIATERILATEHGDIPVAILRLAGAYDEMGHSPPLTQQIKRIYERQLESHLFPGNRDHAQPFVHLDDAVAAIRLTIAQRHTLDPFEVFLIAEPQALSYEQLQDELGQLIHGREWTTLRVPAAVAKAGAWLKDKVGEDTFIKPWMVDLADAHYPASVERACLRLGWTPSHDLRSTLPDMVHNLKRAPTEFYVENSLGEPPA